MKPSYPRLLLTIAALFIGAFASFPSTAIAATPVIITTATQAVFYAQGYVDGRAEAITTTNPLSFREMANIQRELAYRFRDVPLFSLYLFGRAEAFDQVADLAGEP